ncbi:MAG: hypothetical protein IH851_03740 [Armatimonadetes bacterium]|nr:hypothetical protein [Armatimonadota bacterium]
MSAPQEYDELKTVDKSGRLVLGKKFARKLYAVRHRSNGDILLSARAHVHEREAWLLKNPEALASVRRGIEQSKAGRGRQLGSFAEHADDELD